MIDAFPKDDAAKALDETWISRPGTPAQRMAYSPAQTTAIKHLRSAGTPLQAWREKATEDGGARPLHDKMPFQLKLAENSAYTVNQSEQGHNVTGGGNISTAVNNRPSTQVGEVYLVVEFKTKANVEYMRLKPLTSGVSDLFVPVGNDAFYTLEPNLDDSTGWLDNELTRVTGDPYNGQAPDPSDISQGEIGDCWLIAPMMAMTMSQHWNQHISNLTAPQGQDFQVTLGDPANIDSGQGQSTQLVTITGWIPTLPQAQSNTTNQAEFLYAQLNLGMPGQVNGQQGAQQAPVWPSLLEKAAAQSFGQGSYQGLDDNNADMGFKLLGHTGPQTLQNPDANGQPYANMIDAMQHDAAGTATTKKDNPIGQYRLATDPENVHEMQNAYLGLIEDHVYIILNTSTVQNLQLKNPHGQKDPTGPVQQARVTDVIDRIDYLPVPQQQQNIGQQQQNVGQQQNLGQQQNIGQQQQQNIGQQQQNVVQQAQLIQAVQQVHQQIQQLNQQQLNQAQQQLHVQPQHVQAIVLPQIQQVQQNFGFFQQQQMQQAQYQLNVQPQQQVQHLQNIQPNPYKKRKII